MRGIIGAVLVAACLLAGCSGDDVGDTGRGPLDSLETAGPRAGDLFVYGDVLDDGKPAKDVQLQVMMWPERDFAVGESFALHEVEAKVDDGRYGVWVDPDEIPAAYWPADQDFQNFEVMLLAGGSRVTWSTTVWRVDGRGWRSEGARLGDPALRMDFDVSRETVRTTESDGTTSTEKTPVISEGVKSEG